MSNPYKAKPVTSFWKPSVGNCAHDALTLAPQNAFDLSADDRVATAGSCFAQNVAKHIKRARLMHFLQVEEQREDQPLFSANYGNIYTPLQLKQLIERATGKSDVPEDHTDTYAVANGRYLDLYRPYMEPAGYKSLEDLVSARKTHLDAVMRMFRDATVFVFTLGLTECWRAAATGIAFPVAPATVVEDGSLPATTFDNQDFSATYEAMADAIALMRGINPALKIMLTVSPVPLTATYTDHHVLAATTYSKSVLRAVAGELASKLEGVSYFPSYEIITAPYWPESYYDANRRTVSEVGIAHVMRTFEAGYFKAAPKDPGNLFAADDRDVICDDEQSMESIGF